MLNRVSKNIIYQLKYSKIILPPLSNDLIIKYNFANNNKQKSKNNIKIKDRSSTNNSKTSSKHNNKTL